MKLRQPLISRKKFISAAAILLVTMAMGGWPEGSQERLRIQPLEVFSGTTYYVSPSGDDSHPGNQAQPWQTLSHAAATAAAGDRVYVHGGVYAEAVAFLTSGTTDNPIQFLAYASEAPIIEGPAVGSGTGVRIAAAHIKLSGFEIRRWETGIEMEGHHIEIADCRIRNLWYGISPHNGCHDFLITGVELSRFLWYGFDASSWGSSEPVCHSGTLRQCQAHDALDSGLNVDGFAFGDGRDFILENCSASRVFDGFDIKADNTTLSACSASLCANSGYKLWAENILVVNCLGFDNGSSHVELDWDGIPGSATLMNCTFFDSDTFGIWVENRNDRLSMYNCILAGGDNIGLCFEQRNAANYRGDYNIFHNDNPNRIIAVGYEDEFSAEQIPQGAWSSYSGQDLNSLVAAHPDIELFTDPGAWDLHLVAGSAAIDRGTPANAPSADYDCMMRPAGNGFDIGAYEFGSVLAQACQDQPETKKIKRGKIRR